MFFPDYSQTGAVYHVINLNDLVRVNEQGIKYDRRAAYHDRYEDFHAYLNEYRTGEIPHWVDRTKAIFASMNFDDGHAFHSHSMLLAFEADPSRCWVANENRANEVYEPYVLQNIEEFRGAKEYLKRIGRAVIREYWKTSLSFTDNLVQRRDRWEGYDAEVMVFHDIKPENIHYIAIVSDHRIMTVEQWKKTFCSC
jgi:hypothetical protein